MALLRERPRWDGTMILAAHGQAEDQPEEESTAELTPQRSNV